MNLLALKMIPCKLLRCPQQLAKWRVIGFCTQASYACKGKEPDVEAKKTGSQKPAGKDYYTSFVESLRSPSEPTEKYPTATQLTETRKVQSETFPVFSLVKKSVTEKNLDLEPSSKVKNFKKSISSEFALNSVAPVEPPDDCTSKRHLKEPSNKSDSNSNTYRKPKEIQKMKNKSISNSKIFTNRTKTSFSHNSNSDILSNWKCYNLQVQTDGQVKHELLETESSKTEVHKLSAENQAVNEVSFREDFAVSTLDSVAPVVGPSFNFAPFIFRSESLQNLVKLGVDFSAWETLKTIPEYILNLDFETHMKPYIQFLHDIGVPADSLGQVITKNPFIFKQSLEDFEVRCNYLKSRQFSRADIAFAMVKFPELLNLPTNVVEKRLDFIKKSFGLNQRELKQVVTRHPKVISWRFSYIPRMQFSITEELGFSCDEAKSMFLSRPKLWLAGRETIQKRFNLLHNEMGISHKLLTHFPGALLSRRFRVQQRHQFLQHVERAQYDPTEENYVSLQALVSGTDSDFCRNIAKSNVEKFNEFLKTL